MTPRLPRPQRLAANQADAWAHTDEIVDLMLRDEYRTGMLERLQSKWECSKNAAENALARALYFLDRSGLRERELTEADTLNLQWLREAGRDRASLLDIFYKRRGVYREKVDVSVSVGAMNPVQLREALRDSIRNPDETLLETLAEPGMIECLSAMVFQRRKMLVETMGEDANE